VCIWMRIDVLGFSGGWLDMGGLGGVGVLDTESGMMVQWNGVPDCRFLVACETTSSKDGDGRISSSTGVLLP
jgi:hypothetical protein